MSTDQTTRAKIIIVFLMIYTLPARSRATRRTWSKRRVPTLPGSSAMCISTWPGHCSRRRQSSRQRWSRPPSGSWYRRARRNGSGRISVGGVDHAVRFTAADPTVRTQVDEAHRAKYGRYSNLVRPMISDSVAETTLQLQPTISWKDTYPMKATMLDGPGDVRVENRPIRWVKPTDPSSASSAACAWGAPKPPTPRSFRLPTKETPSGWRDLTRDLLTPRPRSAICSASTTVQASLRGCSRRLTPH